MEGGGRDGKEEIKVERGERRTGNRGTDVGLRRGGGEADGWGERRGGREQGGRWE